MFELAAVVTFAVLALIALFRLAELGNGLSVISAHVAGLREDTERLHDTLRDLVEHVEKIENDTEPLSCAEQLEGIGNAVREVAEHAGRIEQNTKQIEGHTEQISSRVELIELHTEHIEEHVGREQDVE